MSSFDAVSQQLPMGYMEMATINSEQQQQQLHRTTTRSSANWSSSSSTHSSAGFGSLLYKSLTRAMAAMSRPAPPKYTRGAWSIINDVPYPPPPPYAGYSSHPPSYEEALEIGVVASPLRVEQQMRHRDHISRPAPSINLVADSDSEDVTVLPRVASAPQLTLLAASFPPEDAHMQIEDFIPASTVDEEYDMFAEPAETHHILPRYIEIDSTVPLSPVVSRWRLGEAAFEKPALHPKGYTYPDAAAAEQDSL
ncbi:hypothetical protein H4R99_007792 [Coemansia sp. RSA 1722]|nr:hypothetical protein IWW45_006979 [Coemansia sp. RSA 485]KAJ2588447.1 hypothetical protein H4R99_007792 [Coemansia sp. RSA 1722]